jgi:large subunit ribosomal protein L15
VRKYNFKFRDIKMKLNELKEKKGAFKIKKRVGRGPGSGVGKTCGRGLKGQKSRSGVSLNGFEGGQMPIYMRLPKRGFNVPNAKKYSVVNIGVLQDFIDRKKINPENEINEETLCSSGVISRNFDGIRLLAKGELKTKIIVKLTGASKGAISAIEKHGGTFKKLS